MVGRPVLAGRRRRFFFPTTRQQAKGHECRRGPPPGAGVRWRFGRDRARLVTVCIHPFIEHRRSAFRKLPLWETVFPVRTAKVKTGFAFFPGSYPQWICDCREGHERLKGFDGFHP
jgi:hypothetical protein